MAANFKKMSQGSSSSRNAAIPAGSKLSMSSNSLLVSSGIPSLDNILGGGIPVGSVLLVEEDIHGTFSNILLRYFVAEGVLCSHGIVVASSCDERADNILKKLPAPLEDEAVDRAKVAEKSIANPAHQDEGELKIAWRYQNIPKNEASKTNKKFGNYYDLSKLMDEGRFTGVPINRLIAAKFPTPGEAFEQGNIHQTFMNVLREMREVLKDYSTSGSSPVKNILRIGVQSFGSPLWSNFAPSDETKSAMARFLLTLRSLLRSAFAVSVVTVPTHLFQNPSCTRRLEQCVDSAVNLESFAGSENEKNPAFKEYDGLIHIKKKSRINCLLGHDIDTTDWAFKLKRKKFVIEKLHLPPDLSETVSRTQNDTKKPSQLAGVKLCSPGVGDSIKALDF